MQNNENMNLTPQEQEQMFQHLSEETRQIANDALAIRQLNHTADKKLNTIGHALIDQRDTLNLLYEQQTEQHQNLGEYLDKSHTQQEEIHTNLNKIRDDIELLELGKLQQDEFVGQLSKLKDKHAELNELHTSNTEESKEMLSEISNMVNDLFESVSNMDIPNQVDIVIQKASEITDSIDGYITKRTDAQQSITNNINELVERMSGFYDNVQKQTETLSKVEEIAERNHKATIALSDKFDSFVDIINLSQEQEVYELEDIFTNHNGKDDPDNTEDVDSNEGDVTPIEQPKKKGFLKRMFGGK